MKHLKKLNLKKLRWLTDFLYKVGKYKSIFIVLIILTLVSTGVMIKNVFGLKDLANNLTAGFITLIITVFVIDVLFEKRRNQELHEAKGVLVAELRQLTTKMTTYLALAMGFDPSQYATVLNRDPSTTDPEQQKKITELVINFVLRENYIESQVHGLSISQWEHFELNLIDIRGSLEEIFRVYQAVLPISLLGKLYKVRKSFADLYFSFGLYSQIFVHNVVSGRQTLKNTMEKSIIKDLENYYQSLDQLVKVISTIE